MTAPAAKRLTLVEILTILRLATSWRWAIPTLVGLGFASSLAESFGITLVTVFLYGALAGAERAASVSNSMGLGLLHLGAPSRATLMAMIVLLVLIRGVLGYLYSIVSVRISHDICANARAGVHAQYLWARYDFVHEQEQGELLDLLATQTWSLATAFNSFTRLIINACSILIFGLFLVMISWRITLAAVIGSVLVSLMLRMLAHPVRVLGRASKEINQDLAARSLITLQGMRTIRAFGQEDIQHRHFVTHSNAAKAVTEKLARLHALLPPATEIGNLAVLSAIIALPMLVRASVAATLASIALLYRLQPHVREFEQHLLMLNEIGPPVRAVLDMLDTPEGRRAPDGVRDFTGLREAIRFENVSLTYRSADGPAVDRLSFHIPAGRTTALFGPSGAGKTSIVNLLLRLYQPDAGRVTVDGVPLDALRRESWLADVAVAGQDIALIEGTISQNLRLARTDARDSEIASAVEAAGLADFVAQLPQGYQSWIGQQGTNLSGGQRQRLGIARALLRDPGILILDEAMSALDLPMEESIRRALDTLFAGRTRIVITHRPEILRDADHIVCIRGGRIIGEGGYEDVRACLADILPRSAVS